MLRVGEGVGGGWFAMKKSEKEFSKKNRKNSGKIKK